MIQLQPFGCSDFDRLIAWISSEELMMQFAGPGYWTFPLTKQQLEVYLQETKRLTYKVVCLPAQTPVGHAEIYRSNEKMATLCRILIGDAANRGKGLGLQLVNHLLHIAFSDHAIETVSLNVFDWNQRAIACYKKAGFIITPGVIKQRMVNGVQWTALNMHIDKARWEQFYHTGV